MTQSPAKPTVTVWTDGSVYPTNPGPDGGWAAILFGEDGNRIRALSGHFAAATNQRAEAFAVLHGLQALKKPCNVLVRTDSEYVIRCLDALKHKRNLKANTDIWRLFPEVLDKHVVTCEHVPGHAGIVENEWANKLAYEAAISRQGIDQYFDEMPARVHRVKHHA